MTRPDNNKHDSVITGSCVKAVTQTSPTDRSVTVTVHISTSITELLLLTSRLNNALGDDLRQANVSSRVNSYSRNHNPPTSSEPWMTLRCFLIHPEILFRSTPRSRGLDVTFSVFSWALFLLGAESISESTRPSRKSSAVSYSITVARDTRVRSQNHKNVWHDTCWRVRFGLRCD